LGTWKVLLFINISSVTINKKHHLCDFTFIRKKGIANNGFGKDSSVYGTRAGDEIAEQKNT
jgi:hypothetical protein